MQLSAIVVRLCYNCLFIWYWSLDWGKLQHQPVRSLSAVFMSRHISTDPRTACWNGRKDLKKWYFKAGILLVLNLYSSGLYFLLLISCIIDDDDDDVIMMIMLLLVIIVIITTITLLSLDSLSRPDNRLATVQTTPPSSLRKRSVDGISFQLR
jgi:hypothetical protein